MPVDVSVHPARRLALFEMHGVITVPDAIDGLRSFVEHPLFDPGLVMLTDARHVDDVVASFIGIVGGAHRSRALFCNFRQEAHNVIYAPQDVAFGMARVMQQVVEPLSYLRFDILRDETEALANAGQDELSFDALYAALSHPAG
ncbi:hypothetical protein [Antarctobacter heliothermus]|nr:hypothetical protein [Antarctobacter heliothermus]